MMKLGQRWRRRHYRYCKIEGNKIALAKRRDNKAPNESRTIINQGPNESRRDTEYTSRLGRKDFIANSSSICWPVIYHAKSILRRWGTAHLTKLTVQLLQFSRLTSDQQTILTFRIPIPVPRDQPSAIVLYHFYFSPGNLSSSILWSRLDPKKM